MEQIPRPAQRRTPAQRDRRFAARWGTLCLLLVSLPYAALLLLGPAGERYTGVLFNPVDAYRYLGIMQHAHDGAWSFTNYFTYVRHAPIAIFTFYTLLGKLVPGSAEPAGLGITFHVAGLVLAGLFIQQAWRLYGEILPGRAARRVAFVLLLVTSGLGVVVLVLGGLGLHPLRETPYDLLFVESSAFFGLLAAPHFAAVLLLITVYARAVHRIALTDGHGWGATAAGTVAAAGLATIHTEKVGVIAIAAFFYLAWVGGFRRGPLRRYIRRVLQAALTVAAAVPYLAYAYHLTVADPTIADILRQGTPPPVPDPIPYYVLGFGVTGLCAIWGLPRVLRRPAAAAPGEIFLWSLALGGLVILIVPWTTIQHRGEGLQLALAGLAGRELVHSILPRVWRTRMFGAAAAAQPFGYNRQRLRLLSINMVVILASWSVLALAIGGIRAGSGLSDQLYLDRDDPAALSWLRSNASPDDVVFGSPPTLQFVAAYSGTRAVWGDFAYTPEYESEGRALAQAFDGNSLDGYLARRGVRWMYFGPREAAHARFDPAGLDFLNPAYRSGGTVIYRVVTR